MRASCSLGSERISFQQSLVYLTRSTQSPASFNTERVQQPGLVSLVPKHCTDTKCSLGTSQDPAPVPAQTAVTLVLALLWVASLLCVLGVMSVGSAGELAHLLELSIAEVTPESVWGHHNIVVAMVTDERGICMNQSCFTS